MYTHVQNKESTTPDKLTSVVTTIVNSKNICSKTTPRTERQQEHVTKAETRTAKSASTFKDKKKQIRMRNIDPLYTKQRLSSLFAGFVLHWQAV